jgi:hypothetical protein
MDPICLVDLSGVFWRNWHGSVAKEATAAYQLTLGNIHKILDGCTVPHAVAVDAGSSFRKEIAPLYKANRPEKDAAASDQLRSVIERLTADGIKVLRAEGWEADDVIATATRWARAKGHPVEIYSADKDLLALVTDEEPRVVAVHPFKGETWAAAGVFERLGVPPDKVPELLSLVGDTSDNIPGVKGIGPVNASKLLASFGSIAGILSACDDPASDIPPAVRTKLVAGIGDLDLSSKLVALRFDAPIDCAQILEPRVIPPPAAPRELGGGKSMGGGSLEHQASLSSQVAFEQANLRQQHLLQRQPMREPPEVKGEPVAPRSIPTSSALARRESESWELSLEPSTPEEAFKMAATIFDGRLFPAYGNEAAVFSIILTGRSLGLSAMASVRGIQMIKGKPCLSADLIVGLVRNSPLCEYFECVETTDTRAKYVTKRRGRPEISYEFTIEEARSRGFTFTSRDGQPAQWSTNPRGMLRAACKRELARLAYEEIVAGVYTPDELQESA